MENIFLFVSRRTTNSNNNNNNSQKHSANNDQQNSQEKFNRTNCICSNFKTPSATTTSTTKQKRTTKTTNMTQFATSTMPSNDTWTLWDLTAAVVMAATTATTAALEDTGGGGDFGIGIESGRSTLMTSSSSSESSNRGNILTDLTNALNATLNSSSGLLIGLDPYNINNDNNINSTNNFIAAVTETPYVPYVMRPETYIVPVLFAFIFIVGVLGNGTLIVVFLGVRQMRNVPNTYIFSLALADMLVIVTTVPLTSTVYTVDSWPWGSFLCTLSEFIKDVSIGVSVFTLTALSGDRYFAIVDPLRKFHAHGGGKRATRMTIAIAVSIWILAIICGIPALMGTYIKKIDINSNKSFSLCYPFPEQWGVQYAKTMVMLRFLVYYAIPLLIIGIFYVLIARHLMYAANVPGEMQGAVRQVRARRKVAVTVLAFVVIFGICFMPYHVFMLWFYYWPTAQEDYNSFWHVLRILGFCLSFANSCANPVALYFVSGAFRKHFNRYLFCQGSGVRHKKRHHNDTICMHRDTSLTSTASKRYHSRRSCHYQSTIRSSRIQETSITIIPNGNQNGGNGSAPLDASEAALMSEYCQHHLQQPQQQLHSALQQQQQQQQPNHRFM